MSIIFKRNRVNGKQHDQSSSGSGVQFYIAKGFFDTIPKALDGPNLFWCRSDWLKQYHFKTPQTLSNVEKIVKVFNQRSIGLRRMRREILIVCAIRTRMSKASISIMP